MPDRYTFHNYDTHGVVVDTQTGEATRYDLVSDAEAAARRLNDQNRRPAMASEVDTSAEAVERLAAHITGGPHEAWEIVCTSTLRALAAANEQLERERDTARSKEATAEITREVWFQEARRLLAERDAANAARVAAEGERDRARKALQKAITYVELCVDEEGGEEAAEAEFDLSVCRAALTPAPEAPKDGE